MIKSEDYKKRRAELINSVGDGIILLCSNVLLARNYKGNPLPFRQDSTFLYYTGLEYPHMMALLDADSGDEILIGNEPGIEDAIWSGPQKSLGERADNAGFKQHYSYAWLTDYLNKARKRRVHFLPAYTAERKLLLATILHISPDQVEQAYSVPLIKSVIKQRSIKSTDEVNEIEMALDQVTGPMHIQCMKMAREGTYEHELVAEMLRSAKAKDMEFAYNIICSVRGETLHNEQHHNQLKSGQLVLIDAGVESKMHYASDITRTTPVNGKFTSQQKDIYALVLKAQLEAIEMIKPGIAYKQIHLHTAKIIAEGLIQLGIMKGNADEAVNAGAHALFFPHGLGHMIGLDVHDMEDLGEDYVGYGEETERSGQFGLAYLRLVRKLNEGFVLTVEPGIYFIPALIAKWRKEKHCKEYIEFSKLDQYTDFGGIRIEDNILVTESGYRILGNPIPKAVDEIENIQV